MISCRSVRHGVVAMLITLCGALPLSAEPARVGWLEGAYLQPWGVRVRAKLDTGAKTSAIHAENIETFERDAGMWVRFIFPYGRREGYPKGFTIERPVVREIRIKGDTGGTAARYVISLDVCVGGKTQTTEVSLSDRSHMNYPMILGRETLAGRFIVDAQQSFMADRSCPRKLAKRPKKK